MPLFSSLVFLGVICSRCCEQHHYLHRDFSTSKTTALPPPPLPLLQSYHKLHHRKVISPICLSMKYRLHRTFHAPPRAIIILGVTGTRLHVPQILFTCRHAPSHASTIRHVPTRTSTRQNSVRWRHHIRHVSPSDVITACVSLLTSALSSDHVITIDRWLLGWPLTLTWHWLWPLTFLQGWLFLSRCSLLSFRVDFIFAVYFCIFCF